MGLAERQNATGATSQPDIIPVTLLTGFLGSGKSTLLSEILRHPEFQNTAVIVNEFGEVGLDGVLICLLYTSPSPRDLSTSRMPSSA